jgi:hypothetical protein
MNSRREETNLTNKFKMQGPNTSKRIMATIGPRKDRNKVLEGRQDFILSHTCVETCFKSLFLEPLRPSAGAVIKAFFNPWNAFSDLSSHSIKGWVSFCASSRI